MNIKEVYLHEKGLHLNKKGKNRLELNFLQKLRNLSWSTEHLNETYDRQFNGISFSNLHALRKSNTFRVIIGHINIDSVGNKFEPLNKMIQDNIDFLLVSETKLDDTFPIGQFYIHGFATPYRFDRTLHSGGILLYITEDISSKILKFQPVQNNFESFFAEINVRKKKWLLSCSYNPTRKNIVNHVKILVQDLINLVQLIITQFY